MCGDRRLASLAHGWLGDGQADATGCVFIKGECVCVGYLFSSLWLREVLCILTRWQGNVAERREDSQRNVLHREVKTADWVSAFLCCLS